MNDLKFDDLLKITKENNEELKKLKKEIFYNRIIQGVFLLLVLFYIHMKIESINDTISLLIQVFMSI